MEQVKFKSSEILISRVKENLSTYDSAGIVDAGKFYFYIKRELQLLGDYIYEDAAEVLDINNGKVLLPEDFIKLYALYSLENNISDKTYTRNGVQQDLVYQVDTEVSKKDVDSCGNNCYSETELIRVTTHVEAEYPVSKVYQHNKLLRYSGRVNTELCDEESPNFYSKDSQEFNIDSNYIYTNFTKGKVLLQYLAFPFDEDGYPMIPDAPKIEKAIETYIMYKVMEYYYINDITNNALQKMQYFQEKYRIAHKSALNYVKLPSYQQSVDAAYKNVRDRFKIFELRRNGRYPYSTPNRDAERPGQYQTVQPRV